MRAARTRENSEKWTILSLFMIHLNIHLKCLHLLWLIHFASIYRASIYHTHWITYYQILTLYTETVVNITSIYLYLTLFTYIYIYLPLFATIYLYLALLSSIYLYFPLLTSINLCIPYEACLTDIWISLLSPGTPVICFTFRYRFIM